MICKSFPRTRKILYLTALFLLAIRVQADPVPVTTKPLADVLFFPKREAPATAMSLNDSHVSAEIRGVLKGIPIRVGDSVSEGDVIAELDCEEYEIAVAKAQANYDSKLATSEFANSQLGNARVLSKNQNISSEEVNRRKSSAATARAETERARANLRAASRAQEKCTIRAPLNAVVIERLANLGDYLVEGTRVARLLDQQNIEVSAKVQEQDLASLRQARALTFVTRENRYPIRLRTVLPMLESRIRSFEVRLEFEGPQATPGSPGRLVWELSVPHLPTDYLVRKKQGIGVFLAAEGKAKFLPLEHAEEGLPAAFYGTVAGQVVGEGRFGLEDGVDVQVVEP